MDFVKIHRSGIAGTATVPASALPRYFRDGWTVVDDSVTAEPNAEETTPLDAPSPLDASEADTTEG